jgi:outer membrane protein insertion porin family
VKIRTVAALFVLVPVLLGAAGGSPQGKPVQQLQVVNGACGDAAEPMVPGKMQTRVGEPFDQGDFDADLKWLSEEYERIEPQIDVRDGQVYLALKVWPRPTIRSICWIGNKYKSTKKLNRKLDLYVQTPFNRAAFQKAFNRVKAYYVDEGFFEAELDYRIVQVSPCEVDLEICVQEGMLSRIRKVFFEGLDCCEEAELADRLVTQQYNSLISWLTEWGTYKPDAVEYDRMQILRYLQNEGYADAQVTVRTEETRKKHRIVVIFTVDKGEVYQFGSVKVKGNLIFPSPLVEALIASRPCDHFSPQALQDSVDRLTTLYGAKGYIEPKIQYEMRLSPDAPCYDVLYTVDPGQIFKVGMVCISGNRQTQSRVILHESLIVPGEVFNLRRVKATEERLKNVGYFKTVRVYTVPSEDPTLGPEYRDVHIEVEEDSTGSLNIFGGFSTLDHIFGGIELSEKNFNIRGLPTIFKKGACALRGGGEYAQLRLTVGQKETSYVAKWTKPYFNDTRWIVGFDLEHSNNRQYSEDFQLDNTSGLFHATYPYNDFLRFGGLYRIRWSYQKLSPELEKKGRVPPPGTLISAVGSSISYNSTDAMVYPTRGTRSDLLFEVAGLGGTARFLNFNYLNALYVPIWCEQRITMKFRADFRFIQPYGGSRYVDIPIAERFFLGGEDTVRGYRSYTIGPFSDGNPIGGISSILLSEEMQWRISNILATFVFVDAGMVSAKTWDIDAFRVSTGLGFRLDLLPSMPLTLGVGWPINPVDKSQIQRFFFAVGARF